MFEERAKALAVLIDGDNASPRYIGSILAAASEHGKPIIKRVYADWTKPQLNGWKKYVHELGLQPVQQFANTKGKNATDGAMMIDAMDLLHTAELSGFCLVSSDSDFARLAIRIREQGLSVFGFGESHTPRSFVAACDAFTFTNALVGSVAPSYARVPNPIKVDLDDEAIRLLANAVGEMAAEDGWADLSRVGAYLAYHAPNFDIRKFGYSKLITLLEEMTEFQVERDGDSAHIVNVRHCAMANAKDDRQGDLNS